MSERTELELDDFIRKYRNKRLYRDPKSDLSTIIDYFIPQELGFDPRNGKKAIVGTLFYVDGDYLENHVCTDGFLDGLVTDENKTIFGKSGCKHQYVDVGFNHPKFVCKFCDKEKP